MHDVIPGTITATKNLTKHGFMLGFLNLIQGLFRVFVSPRLGVAQVGPLSHSLLLQSKRLTLHAFEMCWDRVHATSFLEEGASVRWIKEVSSFPSQKILANEKEITVGQKNDTRGWQMVLVLINIEHPICKI